MTHQIINTRPDQEIINLINDINTAIDSGDTDISHYITKFFGSYLHTKIGKI